MFEALINDQTIFEVTLVLVVLLSIAFWQNLKQFAAILGGIYFIYIIFIISFYKKIPEPQIVEENIVSIINDQIDSVILDKKVIIETDTSKKVIDVVNNIISEKKLDIKPKSISNDEQPINVLTISFGTGIENRGIVDKSSSFTTETNRIYCLSGIQNRKTDTKIFHKWYHDGKLKSKILLNIGKSFNWRTWSYINVYEERVGEWLVVVEDTLGVRHDSLSFNIFTSN